MCSHSIPQSNETEQPWPGSSQQIRTLLLQKYLHSMGASAHCRACMPCQSDQYTSYMLATMRLASCVQEWSTAVKVPLKERSTASNAAKSVYEIAWDCDMPLTRRGVRGEVALDIAVQDFGCVTIPIMAKVYAHGDSSASHGEAWRTVTCLCVGFGQQKSFCMHTPARGRHRAECHHGRSGFWGSARHHHFLLRLLAHLAPSAVKHAGSQGYAATCNRVTNCMQAALC